MVAELQASPSKIEHNPLTYPAKSECDHANLLFRAVILMATLTARDWWLTWLVVLILEHAGTIFFLLGLGGWGDEQVGITEC